MSAGRGETRFSTGVSAGTTYCVRTCDGFYFPLPKGAADETTLCGLTCPGTAVELYRGDGDSIEKSRNASGRRYGDLPRAFAYRQASIPACGCRKPGSYEEWAARLLADPTLQRGDVVVNQESAAVYKGPSKPTKAVRLSQFTDARARGALSTSAWREADRVIGYSFRQELARQSPAHVIRVADSQVNSIVVTPARSSGAAAVIQVAGAHADKAADRPAALRPRIVLVSPFAR